MARKSGEAKGRPGLRRWVNLLLPFVFLLSGAALLLSDPEPVDRLQNWFFDHYQRLRPRPYRDVPVRVVDIDDESLAKLGQFPWPRTRLAEMVDRLTKMGASTIGFDIIFPEPDRTSPKEVLPLWSGGRKTEDLEALTRRFPDHDQVFAKAMKFSRVVLSTGLTDKENTVEPLIKSSFIFPNGEPTPRLIQFSGAMINRPELEKAAAGNGSFTYESEHDGVLRRVPLVQRLRDKLIPSLAAESLRVAQGADTILVKAEAAHGEVTGVDKIKIGDLVIPTDAQGRLWVYFTKPAPARTIPAWRIFDKDFDASPLSGAIVFVGTSAAGLRDQRATPLTPLAPGVENHAQVAEQVLLQEYLVRPRWAADAETVILLVLSSLLILLLQRRGAVWGAAFSALSIAALFSLAWWAFAEKRWLLDPLLPALTVAAVYVSFALINYLRGEREKREIRNAFRYYLSPDLVEQLASNPESLRLGGEMRRMTYHFCDIQGFSAMSEFYDPSALIQLLNSFLSPLTEIILQNHGTIDKYIGDCIMAFWNAPLDDPQHAKNACIAVVEMHERLKTLNEDRRAAAEAEGREFVPIMIRTGLNSGSSMVGNMGSYQRFSYSVIGDDVNLASRLESANKFFGTHSMASEATVAEARDAVEVRRLGSLRVVGKVIPVEVYELVAKKGELSEPWKKAMPLYEKAYQEFYAREFAQAADSFQQVLSILPEDGPSSLYLKFATDYAQLAPPEDWDGVFRLTEK